MSVSYRERMDAALRANLPATVEMDRWVNDHPEAADNLCRAVALNPAVTSTRDLLGISDAPYVTTVTLNNVASEDVGRLLDTLQEAGWDVEINLTWKGTQP